MANNFNLFHSLHFLLLSTSFYLHVSLERKFNFVNLSHELFGIELTRMKIKRITVNCFPRRRNPCTYNGECWELKDRGWKERVTHKDGDQNHFYHWVLEVIVNVVLPVTRPFNAECKYWKSSRENRAFVFLDSRFLLTCLHQTRTPLSI